MWSFVAQAFSWPVVEAVLGRGIVFSYIAGDFLKILRRGRRPSYLDWIGHPRFSGSQLAFHLRPDFGCGHEISARGGILTGSNSSMKAYFFRQIAVNSFTRQFVRSTASLSGHSGELCLLLDGE